MLWQPESPSARMPKNKFRSRARTKWTGWINDFTKIRTLLLTSREFARPLSRKKHSSERRSETGFARPFRQNGWKEASVCDNRKLMSRSQTGAPGHHPTAAIDTSVFFVSVILC